MLVNMLVNNSVIRNQVNIFNLTNITQNNRPNSIHYVERMKPELIPEQLIYTELSRREPTGLPTLRWKGQRAL